MFGSGSMPLFCLEQTHRHENIEEGNLKDNIFKTVILNNPGDNIFKTVILNNPGVLRNQNIHVI